MLGQVREQLGRFIQRRCRQARADQRRGDAFCRIARRTESARLPSTSHTTELVPTMMALRVAASYGAGRMCRGLLSAIQPQSPKELPMGLAEGSSFTPVRVLESSRTNCARQPSLKKTASRTYEASGSGVKATVGEHS